VSLQCVHAVALNVRAQALKGFDAFSANLETQEFALCDGANSCAGSGEAARWLSIQMVSPACPSKKGTIETNTLALQDRLFAAHKRMLNEYPDTGSTLLFMSVGPNNGLILASLGDSFLGVYRPTWGGFGKWKLVHEMARDLDANGHPSQMVGSEVCNTLHISQLPAKGTYCVVMMSDGPGLLMNPTFVSSRLSTIGSQQPSESDLQYLCVSMAEHALNKGCLDDTSVAMVWIKFT